MARIWTAVLIGFLLLGGASSATADNNRAAPQVHVVYPGQTLGAIAKRYNVTVEAICRASGIRRGAPIKPKQRLLIPASNDKDGSRAAKEREAGRFDEPGKAKDTAKKSADGKKAERPTPAANAWKRYARPARRAGYVRLESTTGSYQGYVVLKGDKLSSSGRRGISKVLASWRTGEQIEIDERLIRLMVKVSDTFGGRTLKVASGFREKSHAADSRHKKGRATDFSIPGVPNEALRDYLKTLDGVGVGYYPNASFVHLDVRQNPMYWVDVSRPGEPPQYTVREPLVSGKKSGR
jgi:uncharacterized protein YcbK (DUF882 family)